MNGQTTFTQFGPDPPLAGLSFAGCLPPNPPSVACDNLMGSAQHGSGICADSSYAKTTYCACINNAIPCPMVAAAACANSAFAYLPTNQLPPNGTEFLACKDRQICVNLVEVGGSQNVVSGITQQCGPITNIYNSIKANPTLAILAFLLFILLVVLMSMRTGDTGKRSTPPPPPAGLFGDTSGPPDFP